MCVCTGDWMDGWVDIHNKWIVGWTNGWRDGYTKLKMNGRLNVYTDVWIY